MATTNKSTKAKTKKSAVRAVKTTRPASVKRATTKAKTAKKPAVSKPATVSKTPVASKGDASIFTKLNILSAFVSIVGAIAAALLMNNQTYELVKGLMAKNELAAESAAPFVTAVQHVYDLELRWAVVGIMLISAVMPILLVTVYKNRYVAAIRRRVNGFRWVETAIVSALIIEVVALLSGISDILTLKLLAGLIVVTCALGWVAEKRNLQAGRPVKSELVISVVTGALPWLLIGGFALCTYIFGRITSPWYVYALYAIVVPGFTAYCLNLKSYVMRKVTDYELIERNHITLNILIKVAFVAVLISGLR